MQRRVGHLVIVDEEALGNIAIGLTDALPHDASVVLVGCIGGFIVSRYLARGEGKGAPYLCPKAVTEEFGVIKRNVDALGLGFTYVCRTVGLQTHRAGDIGAREQDVRAFLLVDVHHKSQIPEPYVQADVQLARFFPADLVVCVT